MTSHVDASTSTGSHLRAVPTYSGPGIARACSISRDGRNLRTSLHSRRMKPVMSCLTAITQSRNRRNPLACHIYMDHKPGLLLFVLLRVPSEVL